MYAVFSDANQRRGIAGQIVRRVLNRMVSVRVD